MVTHGLNHFRNDGLACRVIGAQTANRGLAVGDKAADDGRTFFRQDGFTGFRIVIMLAVDETLTVAYHPYLTMMATVNDATGRQTFLRMAFQSSHVESVVSAADKAGQLSAKRIDIGGLVRMADKLGYEHHAIASVGAVVGNVDRGFARAAVDDSYKVISDHYAVFCFCRFAFGDYVLLYYLHKISVPSYYCSVLFLCLFCRMCFAHY